MVDEFFLVLGDAVVRFLDLDMYLEDPTRVRVRAGDDMWMIFHSLKGYTRGAGFWKLPDGAWTMNEDLQAVLMTVGGRYIGQMVPGQTMRFIEDLSDVERSILHQYRVRAG